MMLHPLTPSDLDALLALDATTNSHPWNAAQWRDSLAQHLCLGLEVDRQLAGFAVAMPLLDEAELLLIAIHPDQQHQGCGKALFAALRAELAVRQCERLFLEVRESNLQARHFYTAAGLTEVGRRKHYYPAAEGREDALLLAGATR